MEKIGLVLEGGGSRGVYTAGVLQYLMEEEIYLPYVIGVSAGACNGSSYIARQIDRNRAVTIDYVDHPDYLSLCNFIKKRELFGMDFLFDTLPNQLVPFDFRAFQEAEEEFVIGTTDCITGEPTYFSKSTHSKDALTLIRASSSLPLVAPVVDFEGRKLMDGGIADPIPVKQSVKDGNKKNIVVLTQNRGYVKKPQKMIRFLKRKYGQYPGLIEAIEKRHLVYNETLEYIFEEEKKGNILVVCPAEKLEVGRVTRDKAKLTLLYEQGIADGKKMYEQLKEFIS